jgi:hypothetical protein
MSAGFAVVESFVFTGCSWGAAAETGAACGLCAAKAEDRCGFSRIAAMPNKAHEIAAMLGRDERRKSSSRNLPSSDAIPPFPPVPVTPGHLPLLLRVRVGCRTALKPKPLKHRGAGNRGWSFLVLRIRALVFPPCAKYFSYSLLTFHCRLF